MRRTIRNLIPPILLALLLIGAPEGLFSGSNTDFDNKISRSLLNNYNTDKPDETVRVWIYFKDAEEHDLVKQNRKKISKRAVRRIRARATLNMEDYNLKNVPEEYIEILKPLVRRIRFRSCYFNAISADVCFARLHEISRYYFVRSIEPVASFRRGDRLNKEVQPEASERVQYYSNNPLFGKYGASLGQLDMIEAAQLLEYGYNGSGDKNGHEPILLCLLDSGFDLNHEAFSGINIIAERDFIQNDSVTSNEPGDTVIQDRHGTVVLGVLAGYHEGDLIGPAWGADFILAKTENMKYEKQIEEDTWIKGLEWADSAGADIVSSSLGYSNWYVKGDFDGQTAACTRAAVSAASRGIVVVNAVGNNGWMGDTSLVAPADADSIIAVGSVDRYKTIAWSSSRGPTADGRIKPEVLAQGEAVHTVDPGTVSGYGQYWGTSLATPLIAGLCAQLLDLNPYLTVMELRNAILSSATKSDNPDNSYGYGIAQGLKASGLQGPNYSEGLTIKKFGPNPFNSSVHFELFSSNWVNLSVRVFDCKGALVRTLVDEAVIKLSWEIEWDGRNDSGKKVSAGIYFLSFNYGDQRETCKVVLIN